MHTPPCSSSMKYFFIISNILLTGFFIIIANSIITPLLAAVIIAILLKPFSAQLERLGLPRMISALLLVIAFFLAIIFFISYFTTQLASIAGDTSLTSSAFENVLTSLQNWLSEWTTISLQTHIKPFSAQLVNFINSIASYFPAAIAGTFSYLSLTLLFIFSLFFFLYYRSFFLSFIYQVFDKKNADIKLILEKIEAAVKNYIVGLFFVIATIAFLNATGLLLLGIRHAIFFGIFASMLTIIPYIGIALGSLLPAIFALITTDSLWYPAGVILCFSFVQFLEGNFITPLIIGHQVNVNPYFAILGLFIGGMLLGFIGVILAIPLLGIIKIICDHIEYFQPFGYLLGRPQGKNSNFSKQVLRFFAKIKK